MSRKLLQSTAVVSSMTLVSRLLGYVRDMVIAVSFGATGATDAFFVAFRIPNMLRRMFAEGAFSQAFVPVFTEHRETGREHEVRDLVDHVAGSLTLILAIITTTGVLAAPWLILLFAPGFADEPDRQQLATEMLRLTFPYVLFISLTAMAGGILNSYGKFAVPAFTPVFLNLALIAAALWLAPKMENPVTALAWGVFAAGIVQLLFQLPALKKLGLIPRMRLNREHPGVKKILNLMLPALFGSSVAQINLLINTLIASFLIAGSISWLYFSDRFVELPLALFGVALGTVILPRLSAQHSNGAAHDFSQTLDWGLRIGAIVALPAMLGLMLLAGPILATLLEYKAFTAHDTRMAAISLAAYALGLPAFVAIKVLAPGFFSRQNTRTPVRIGLIAMGVNLALNLLVVVPWIIFQWPAGHAVLALSTAIAAHVNAQLLLRHLRRGQTYQPDAGWKKLFLQIAAGLLLMGLTLWWLTPALPVWQSWHAGQRALALAGLIILAAAVYLSTLWLAGVRPREILRSRV